MKDSFISIVNKLGTATVKEEIRWLHTEVLFRADGLDVNVKLLYPSHGAPHGLHISKGVWVPRYPDKPRNPMYGDLRSHLTVERAKSDGVEIDTSGIGRWVDFTKEGGGYERKTVYPIVGACLTVFRTLSRVQLGALYQLGQLVEHKIADYQVVEQKVAWGTIEQQVTWQPVTC